MLRQGTVVDATIIHAPSSTKNKEGRRDPEMHQTKKGIMYFFGIKAHIGIDAESGLVHSLNRRSISWRAAGYCATYICFVTCCDPFIS